MKLPTYPQYLYLDDDEREKLYHKYCKKYQLDPEVEYSVFEFFDAMDKIKDKEDDTEQRDAIPE